MVTCYLEYEIDPHKLEAFERYAKLWIPLVNAMGGKHHGYFLPHESGNTVAYALFSFPSLADYETYRLKIPFDPHCQAAIKLAEDTRCIVKYERRFMRPVLE
jgi:NIPSNAP